MDVQKLINDFNGVLEDAHKTGVSLDDPIDRAMIVSMLIRLIELAVSPPQPPAARTARRYNNQRGLRHD